MKPDPRIYAAAEAAAGVAPSRILFLDDRAENVQAAIDRGWQAAQCLGRHPGGRRTAPVWSSVLNSGRATVIPARTDAVRYRFVAFLADSHVGLSTRLAGGGSRV